MVKLYTIDNNQYYMAEKLKEIDPVFFVNTRNIRAFVKNKNLTDNQYIYAYIKNGKWIISKSEYPRAKLLISKKWANKNIPQLVLGLKNKKINIEYVDEKNNVYDYDDEITINKKKKKDLVGESEDEADNDDSDDDSDDNDDDNDNESDDDSDIESDDDSNIDSDNDSDDEEINKSSKKLNGHKIKQIIKHDTKEELNLDVKEISPAPSIIKLKDHEKFTDIYGNVINIEMRGDRYDPDQCFFRVKDVSNGFDLPNLNKILIQKTSGYKYGTEYKYFTIKNKINHSKIHTKKESKNKYNIKKELFLTFDGIIHVLYGSRSGNADKFRKWATRILYIHKMGTAEQRDALSVKLTNPTYKTVLNVLNKNAVNLFPCIYLFSLGTVKKLKKSFNIEKYDSEDDIVVKYGRTDNLSRRMKEHENNYGKIKNVQLELLMFTMIDSEYTANAESKLSVFMKQFKLKHDKFNELAIIKKSSIKDIKIQYSLINEAYGGRVNKINSSYEMDMLKKDNEYQKIISEKNEIISEKDAIIKEKENELLRKELEFMKEINRLKKKYKNRD